MWNSLFLVCLVTLLLPSFHSKKTHFSSLCAKQEKAALISVFEPEIIEIDYRDKDLNEPQFILGISKEEKIVTFPRIGDLKNEGLWCVGKKMDDNGKTIINIIFFGLNLINCRC